METDRNIADKDSRMADRGELKPGEVVHGHGRVRRSRSKVDTPRPPSGVFALELFSGKSRLSGAWIKNGLRVVTPFDNENGTEYDLSLKPVQDAVISWIREKRVWLVFL